MLLATYHSPLDPDGVKGRLSERFSTGKNSWRNKQHLYSPISIAVHVTTLCLWLSLCWYYVLVQGSFKNQIPDLKSRSYLHGWKQFSVIFSLFIFYIPSIDYLFSALLWVRNADKVKQAFQSTSIFIMWNPSVWLFGLKGLWPQCCRNPVKSL